MEQRQLVGLITRRSGVRIPPPQQIYRKPDPIGIHSKQSEMAVFGYSCKSLKDVVWLDNIELDRKGEAKMTTELKAPSGKIRVVGVDIFDHEDYLVGDFTSRNEAFKVADDHNIKRSGSMDDVYYVYDDAGRYIRGNEAVGQKVSP